MKVGTAMVVEGAATAAADRRSITVSNRSKIRRETKFEPSIT
jgi:hypothetical protein